MNRKSILVSACVTVMGLSVAGCQNGKAAEQAKLAEANVAMQLPKGWTEADVKAMTEAATPGKNQELLAKDAGTWRGTTTFWMDPDAQPSVSKSSVTDTVIMDGRYIRTAWNGEMPGAGKFTGLGLKGYDNAAGKFVSTWVDNMGTGIMHGTGELSADGKAINWTYHYTCPVTKKPVVMRQIETWKDDKTKTLEMWGQEPKTGKEFKMMFAEMTRK